jgi:hypothetical protein
MEAVYSFKTLVSTCKLPLRQGRMQSLATVNMGIQIPLGKK